ncbi:FCD domain-containing protein [Shigella flexneri]
MARRAARHDYRKPVLPTWNKIFTEQRIAIERKQLVLFFELDDSFHQLLTQIADCQLAWDTIENLKATVDRVCYIGFRPRTPPEMLLRQHSR